MRCYYTSILFFFFSFFCYLIIHLIHFVKQQIKSWRHLEISDQAKANAGSDKIKRKLECVSYNKEILYTIFSSNHLKLITIMKIIIDLWHVEGSGNKSQLVFSSLIYIFSIIHIWAQSYMVVSSWLLVPLYYNLNSNFH